MKIKKIELENFKSFYGMHSVEISSTSDKNITIFLGANNTGKTSLMEAVKWCLYNEIPEEGERGLFVNYERSSELREKGGFRVCVTITFDHDDHTYRVVRKADIQGERDAKKPDPSLYVAEVTPTGSSRKLSSLDEYGFQNLIDAILPQNISQYFIVDGDKISEFVRPTASQTREAIENLLKFEHLRRASDHLKTLKLTLERRLIPMTKGSRSGGDIELKHRALEKRIDNNKRELDEKHKDLKRATAMHHDLETKVAEATDSLEKLKEANSEGKVNEKAMENMNLQLKELTRVLADGYLKALDSPLRKVWTHLNDSREKGKLPKHYEDVFIQDLIRPCDEHGDSICICGTKFNAGSSQYKTLKVLLESTPPKSLTDKIYPLQILLIQAQKKANNIDINVAEYRDRIDALEDDISNRHAKIEAICKEIDKEALEIQEPVFREKAKLEKKCEELDGDIIILKHEIRRDMADLEELSKKIEKTSKTDKRTEKLRKRIEIVSDSKKAIDDVYDKYKIALRKELVDSISNIFLKIITAEENFSKFEIDEEFNYDILNKNGVSWKRHLSNAQRKIFSLSFVAGLRLVAEEEAPFILDSPLGVIDLAHRRNYANIVPALASQLVLLLTDSEGTDEFLERINKRVGAYWKIEYDSKTNHSRFERLK